MTVSLEFTKTVIRLVTVPFSPSIQLLVPTEKGLFNLRYLVPPLPHSLSYKEKKALDPKVWRTVITVMVWLQ